MDPRDRSTSRRNLHAQRVRRLVVCAMAALALPACKSNPRYDLIEAELRTRERELAEARAELNQTKLLADAYQRGLLRPGVCDPLPNSAGTPAPLPLREIFLASGTGGIDNDNLPGDESLQVVVVPRDEEGSAVKVPARLTVWVFEITREGLKNPIGTWEVTPDQLKKSWRGGLFSTGYHVTLQWDMPPTTERIRVAVRLTTLDGRSYEADRDVGVRPLPNLPAPGTSSMPTSGDVTRPSLPAAPTIPPPGLPTPAVPRMEELLPEELPPPKPTGSYKAPAARLAPPQPLR